MAVFAILLPVTSRPAAGAPYAPPGAAAVDALVGRLDTLAAGLAAVGADHTVTVTVGLDADDGALGGDAALAPFASVGLPASRLTFAPPLTGRLCAMWNALAAAAVEAPPLPALAEVAPPPPTYLLLLGDDVVLRGPAAGWGDSLVADFAAAAAAGAPRDAGVVAAVDETFPGFPTFPVLHASHVGAFGGRLLPPEFDGANQGGDPYLWELYARLGAATFATDFTVANTVGGNAVSADAAPPRYARRGPAGGRCGTVAALDRDEAALRSYLSARDGVPPPPVPRMDVVVPCWRVDPAFIRRICTLPLPPRAAATTFIIIVDNPDHPRVPAVVALEAELWATARRRVRVRVNDRNVGVSASRNRGLREATAPHVLFLDDDVIPDAGLLHAYADALAASAADAPPSAARGGAPPPRRAFAGLVRFPPATTAFAAALVVTRLVYFFGAAADSPTVPWGVTANLLLPAAALGEDPFDTDAPAGGGGEDVLVCARLASAADGAAWPLLSVPAAVVVHPWWEGGRRCYRHFAGWSAGDGRLADLLPAHTYRSLPNGPELLLLVAAAAPVWVAARGGGGVVEALSAAAAVVAVDVAVAGAVTARPRRAAVANGRVRLPPSGWVGTVAAAVEAAAVLWAVDGGRLVGHVGRGRLWTHVGRRFDWWLGSMPAAVVAERRRAAVLCGGVLAVWGGLAGARWLWA